MTLFITDEAKVDIENILAYTLKNWGEKQATKYSNTIKSTLFSMADNPFLLLSKERVVKRTTFRTFAFEKHIVFYKIETERVVIVRILHQSMEAKRHL